MSSFFGSLFGSSPSTKQTTSSKTPPPKSPGKLNNNNNQNTTVPSPKCTPSKSSAVPKSNRNNNNINGKNITNNNNKAPLSPRPAGMLFSSSSSQQTGNNNRTSVIPSYLTPSHAPPTRDNIKVTVRVRPVPQQTTSSSSSQEYFSLNSLEPIPQNQTQQSALIADELAHQLFVQGRHEPFCFNQVLSETTSQQDTYNLVAKPLLDDALKGFNSCLFAYGQTGSGKTHSMLGNSQKVQQPPQQNISSEEIDEDSSPTNNNNDDGGEDSSSSSSVDNNQTNNNTNAIDLYPNLGIVPRLCKDLFARLAEMKKKTSTPDDNSTTWIVNIGFVEIYNEQVFDLLDPSYANVSASFSLSSSNNINNNSNGSSQPSQSNNNMIMLSQQQQSSSCVPSSSAPCLSQSQPAQLMMNLTSQQSALLTQMNSKSLEVREDTSTNRFFVENQRFIQVHTAEQVSRYLERGLNARRVAETCMNERSSRSHALFQIVLEETLVTNNSNSNNHKQHHHLRIAKANFCDLAGSENLKRTEAQGQQRVEGGHINKSLLALRQVIDERAQGNSFVSYRNSVLTKLLKDSLGGNSKTAMLACVSPLFQNLDETMNTLRYASKACNIVNLTRVNEKHLISPLPTQQMQNQVAMLSAQIVDLEQQLDVEKQNAEGFQDKVLSFESKCGTLERSLEERAKLFLIQEQEIAELKRQLESTRQREQDALKTSLDASKHFKTCEDGVKNQIEFSKQEFAQQKKKWENAKATIVKKFEKEIDQLQNDLSQARSEHSEIVEKLNSEALMEKNQLVEKLKIVEEKSFQREQELLAKIEKLQKDHDYALENLKKSFEEKRITINEDSASEVLELQQEITSLCSENEKQKQQFSKSCADDKKTIAHLEKIILGLECSLGELQQHKMKEISFLNERTQVLQQIVQRLESQLKDNSNNNEGSLLHHHSAKRRERENNREEDEEQESETLF